MPAAKVPPKVAIELVKIALESGALKLNGPPNGPADVSINIERDSKYLLGLLHGLSDGPFRAEDMPRMTLPTT